MTVEIKIEADFFKNDVLAGKWNCEKCSFQKYGLCLSAVEGIREKCGGGNSGYWNFSKPPEGKAAEA